MLLNENQFESFALQRYNRTCFKPWYAKKNFHIFVTKIQTNNHVPLQPRHPPPPFHSPEGLQLRLGRAVIKFFQKQNPDSCRG